MPSLTIRQAAILLGVVILIAVCWLAYGCLHPPQPVTFETQTQAETAQGIQQAAEAARVPVSESHAAEIAQDIKEAARRAPDSTVATTGKDMTKVVEEQRQKAGADFAIVTDPKHPDEKPEVKPADPVVLNQYNIKAYPGHLWSGTYYANKSADVAWQVRIGKSGTYIGPAVMCADGKVTYGIRVTGTY